MILPKVLLSIWMVTVVVADEAWFNCEYYDRCPLYTGFIPFRRNDSWWCSKPFGFPTGDSPVSYETAQEICEKNFLTLSSIETVEEKDYYQRFAIPFGVKSAWLGIRQNSAGQYEWADSGNFDRTISPQPVNMAPGKFPAFVWDSEINGISYGHFEGVNLDGTGEAPANMVLCGYPGVGPLWN